MAEQSLALDSILEESVSGPSASFAAAGGAAAIPNFCQYWPYIRQFLEWAKGQTSNPIVKLIISGLITLGNRQCGG